MMDLKIDFKEFEQSLQGAVSQIGFSAGKIVKEQAEEIMAESRKQVPSETGALESTAFVETDSTFLGGQAKFGYTGNAANPKTGEQVSDYMVAVHERLDLSHEHGKAKFLEDPVQDFVQNMESTLGSKISDVLSSIFRR